MSHKVFQCGASLILALAISFAGFTPALAAPPANDNFADATVISGLPYFDVVDNTEATREIDEPPDCSGSAWTIWYSFTPTTDTWIQVDMAGSTFSDTILAVFQDTGAGLGGLSLLDCMAWGDYIHLSVQAGKTYYFQVGSIYNQGNLQVNLQEISPLLNDDFVNATDIPSLPFSGTVDNKGATVELDEPQNCSSPWTVWYSFTPTINTIVMANTAGGNVGDTTLGIYQQNGIGLSGLSFLNCASWGDSVTFNVQAGTTYYIQLGSIYNRGVLQVNLWKILPPPNDDFANATLISSPLPFDDSVEFNAATSLEASEPTATCAWNGNSKTVWYTFTPTTSGSVSANIPGGSFTPVFAVYTGDLLTNLTQIGCQPYSGNLLTFHVDAGTTYYFQIGKLYPWESDGTVQFHIDVAPPPTTWFWFNPPDPTFFDTIQFNQSSYDPGNVGFKSFVWDFGDGTTTTEWYPTHKYAADGDYTVQLTVTTHDDRTGSTSQVVPVKTHDVAVTKISAPQSANSGQSRSIVIYVNNKRYGENVRVDLYKSVQSGFEWVGYYNQFVPVRSANRTTSFTFNYTFTKTDANIGKVTFKATATIIDARDAWLADNEAISSPTRVAK